MNFLIYRIIFKILDKTLDVPYRVERREYVKSISQMVTFQLKGTVFEFSRPPPYPHTAALTSPSSLLNKRTHLTYHLEHPQNPPRVVVSVPPDP